MTKDHYSIRLDNGLRAELEEWAEEDERSLPWIIHHILRQAVNERRALDPCAEIECAEDE